MSDIEIDKIVRSKRRTVGIEINQSGELVVRAPTRASMNQIWKFVREKKQWILKHQHKNREKKKEVEAKTFADGELFFYLGDYFKLQIVEGQGKNLVFDNCFYLSDKARGKAKDHFERWYKKQAHIIIKKQVAHYADLHDLKYWQVKINSARTRYGSCTSRKNLNFTWRLVLAPIEVLDYVVIHELAHLEQMNHSKRFWNKVSQMMPDYKIWRKWLKENGHLLEV